MFTIANRFWVGNSGNINDPSHWSTTSGGTGGASVPTSSDNVYFDANSFSTTGQIVTINVSFSCLDMDWTNATNNPSVNGGNNIYCYGSLTLATTGMNFYSSYNSDIYMMATNSVNITTNGNTLYGLVTYGIGGIYNIVGNLTCNYITVFKGTLNTNGYVISNVYFYCAGSDACTLNFSTSIWTLSDSWDVGSATNLTLNASTSKIVMTGLNKTFSGGGKTYYKVELQNNTTIAGNNTFTELKLTATKTFSITASSTQTIDRLGMVGTSGNLVTIKSTINGTSFLITKSSGSYTVNYCSIRDCTSAVDLNAYNSTDATGNINVNFLAGSPVLGRYWVGGTGNINDINHWSLVSGGASGASVPTSSDNAYFDANSFLTTGQSVIANANISCLSFDWTGVTNTPAFSGDYNVLIYENLKFVSGMTTSGYTGLIEMKSITSGKTVITNGRQLAWLAFNGVGGEWTLQDALTVTNTLYLQNGTLNTNNVQINAGTFNSSYSNVRTLNLGTSIINLTSGWTFTTSTNLTLNAGTSKIIMSGNTKTFAGGGKVYYDLQLQGTPITISGNNTFHNLILTATKVTKITGTSTQVISDMPTNGTLGNLITLESTSIGTPYTISKPSGTLTKDYYNITDCVATGGASFFATNSINGGNNTGWLFYQNIIASCSLGISSTVNICKLYNIATSGSLSITSTQNLKITRNLTTSCSLNITASENICKLYNITVLSNLSLTSSDNLQVTRNLTTMCNLSVLSSENLQIIRNLSTLCNLTLTSSGNLQVTKNFNNYITKLRSRTAQRLFKMEILDNNEQTIDEVTINVIDGDIQINNSNNDGLRRSANIIFENSTGLYIPNYNGFLWINKKFRLWTGVKLDNGTDYYVSRGIFLCAEPEITSNLSENTTSIVLYDKWTLLDGTLSGNLESTYIIPVGTPIFNAVNQLLIDAGEVKSAIIEPTTEVTPYSIFQEEGNYGEILLTLARMLSWRVYFDINGYLHFESRTNLETTGSSWDFNTNEITYLNSRHRYEFSKVYNNIIVIGDNVNGATVRATATDNSSETGVLAIGKKTKLIKDELINTVPLAQERANAELEKSISLVETTDISAMTVDFLEADDIITITDTSTGLNENRFKIISISFPLTVSGEMSIQAWKGRVIVGE